MRVDALRALLERRQGMANDDRAGRNVLGQLTRAEADCAQTTDENSSCTFSLEKYPTLL